MIASSAILTTMIALASWFLGISLLVQVVQELYKVITSSKSRAYSAALTDFAGPFARQLAEANVAPELTVRGPFQFRRRQPRGRLLPMAKETLVTALERTAPVWHRLTREALELETELQEHDRRPSATFEDFLNRLVRGMREEPGKFDAISMGHFLNDRGVRLPEASWPGDEPVPTGLSFWPPGSREFSLNAPQLLAEFRAKYSPEIVRVEAHFGQLMQNYEYAYRRRNLRQTFIFALLLAVWFDWAFDSVYARATGAPAVEPPAAIETTTQQYQKPALPRAQPTATPMPEQPGVSLSYLPQPRIRNLVARMAGAALSPVGQGIAFLRDLGYYMFGCLLTAVLVCFGAPFWNDLTKSLLRIAQGNGRSTKEPDER